MRIKIAYSPENVVVTSGADPGFQVRGGAHLKKSRRAEGGAKNFGVFRVKNHDHIFSNFRGGAPPLDPPLHLSDPVLSIRPGSKYPNTRREHIHLENHAITDLTNLFLSVL